MSDHGFLFPSQFDQITKASAVPGEGVASVPRGQLRMFYQELRVLRNERLAMAARIQELVQRVLPADLSFFLVLIDCNEYTFLDDLLERGRDGGTQAASMLESAITRHGSIHCNIMESQIVARVYANPEFLAKKLQRHGSSTFAANIVKDFSAAFSDFRRTYAFCSTTTAGECIKDCIRTMASQPHCRGVFLAVRNHSEYKALFRESDGFEVSFLAVSNEAQGIRARTPSSLDVSGILRDAPWSTRINHGSPTPEQHITITTALLDGLPPVSQRHTSSSSNRDRTSILEARGPIPVNSRGQRVEPASIRPQVWTAYNRQVALRRLCSDKVFFGDCGHRDCQLFHGPCDADVVRCLRWMLKAEPCWRGTECRYSKCLKGHHCQEIRCDRSRCRMLPSLHGIDQKINYWVGATDLSVQLLPDFESPYLASLQAQQGSQATIQTQPSSLEAEHDSDEDLYSRPEPSLNVEGRLSSSSQDGAASPQQNVRSLKFLGRSADTDSNQRNELSVPEETPVPVGVDDDRHVDEWRRRLTAMARGQNHARRATATATRYTLAPGEDLITL